MDQKEFSNLLRYDPETGFFFWKVNRKGHARAGDVAGFPHRCGYIQIGVNGKSYLAHRIALIISGINLNQSDQVDHINGCRTDNRLKNLRLASHGENCQNTSIRKDNTSGFKGVGFDKKHQKWRARVGFNGVQMFIGHFDTAERAHAAYCATARKLHGEFFRDHSSGIGIGS